MNLAKKLAAVLLSILMAVVFMPAAAFAADAQGTAITFSGGDPGTATLKGGGPYVVNSGAAKGSIVVESGSVKITLNADFEGTIHINSGASLVLDLNGHNISTPESWGAAKSSLFNEGTLTVNDSAATRDESGTIHAYFCALMNVQGATATLNGGKYRTDAWYCFCLMDIDHFKSINDGYSHMVGDRALSIIAEALMRLMRNRRLHAARWGGDEFMIFGSLHAAESEDFLKSAIRASIREVRDEYAFEVPLEVSIGACIVDSAHTPLDDILNIADKALHEEKKLHHAQRISS